jgi:lysophospholipase L1-like esterase
VVGKRLSHLLKNFLALLLGVAIALGIGEVAVRLVSPQLVYRFPQGMFVNDEKLAYRLTPNFKGISSTSEYRTAIQTNSIGLREDREFPTRQPGIYRVLALGDSFTMGVGVEANEAMAKVVESMGGHRGFKRPIQVINGGVPGYNTEQELALLEQYGLSLKPDLVMLGFYVGNDIQDNYHNPRLRVIDGYLQDGEPPAGLLPYRLRVFLETRSHLYRFSWPIVRRLTDAAYSARETQAAANQLAIFSRTDSDAARDMWSANRKQLADAARLAKIHGLDLLVVVIPDAIQLDKTRWNRLIQRAGASEADFDPLRPSTRIVSFCKELSIPAIDLLPPLSTAMESAPMYLPLDGHWTKLGNQRAAEVVFDYLANRAMRNHATVESGTPAIGGSL